MATEQSIYTTGGTVQAGGGIYISRKADDELLQLCRDGQFAYVLTSRQMGKSSLMVQTAQRLADEGVTSVIIDLTKIGTAVTAEQWYLGLLTEMDEVLMFDTNIFDWWEENNKLGVTQRLTKFFEEVLLYEVNGRITVFVDEIDTTLNLEFTDDFFIAIRYFYTARAQKELFERLSFVLIGVASPGDLIRDPQRTPFNVGKQVILTDFTASEITPLMTGLSDNEKKARKTLDWILDWTGGHPYLTQHLCQEIITAAEPINSFLDVSRIVTETFFLSGMQKDSNLQFVRDMLTKRSPNSYETLTQYREIVKEKNLVLDEEGSIIKSHLKLSGSVKSEDGRLRVRNRIYKSIFNLKWVNSHIPINWSKTIRTAAIRVGIIFLLIPLPVSIYAESQRREAQQQREIAEEKTLEAQQQREIAEEKTLEAQQQREEAIRQKQLVEQLLLGTGKKTAKQDLSPEIKAFLDTLAWSLEKSLVDNYKLTFTGEEFDDFSDHPRRLVRAEFLGKEISSDAAGRYHIISQTWDDIAWRLNLSDFSPESQDQAAVSLLERYEALEFILSGDFESAVDQLSYVWVSLPTKEGNSRFGYRVTPMDDLKIIYQVYYSDYVSNSEK